MLSPEQLAQLIVSAEREPFDGDARLFRLGVEAHRLGLAYEYDPYFSLSIARVDPLPHQLEAVYGYFLRLPRIRFLLADDPGAGKTIMAGLTPEGTQGPRAGAADADRRPGEPDVPVAAGAGRQVPREVPGHHAAACCGPTTARIPGRSTTRSSRPSPGSRSSKTLAKACFRSRWDLVIVDEAHKMSARSEEHKTYAYRLGEALSKMTDHFLLMTATPHKGDPDHFRRFLALLDPDVYGSIQSLQEAMRRQEAPFYLRRTKEALVTFPDPETGEVRKLFTKREVRTAAFDLVGDELDFYDELTRYVEDQSIAAAQEESARGRAVGFTMAMLQRRMASSIYAVRRTPGTHARPPPEDPGRPRGVPPRADRTPCPRRFRRLTEEEQQEIIAQLEEEVLSADPAVLRDEIARLSKLIDQAQALEAREIETKLNKLHEVLTTEGIFSRPEDEAAGVHRAQGHPRLSRRRRPRRAPAGQAPRLGPDGHADPRRDEDRRPRHAGHAASAPSGSSRRRPRCSWPPRRPAKASTSSSAG